MAIDDVDVQFSHGWWFRKLANQQSARYPELEALKKRYDGEPPLPVGANEKTRPAYQAFQKLARTTYEDTIVRAVLDRQTPVGFRTAAAGDEGGDAAAAQIWAANEMPVRIAQVLEHKLSMREGYLIVGPPDDYSDGEPVITAEDPRQVIAAVDPVRDTITRAALKTYHDPDLEQDIAYVYLGAGAAIPGRGRAEKATVRRAVRKARTGTTLTAGRGFSKTAWSWEPDPVWTDNGLMLPMQRCPVVRVGNRAGLAEFEKHVPLIDRIRHDILQRLVMVTLQAFRQRAAMGLPDRYPDNYPVAELRGKEIDYSDIFIADPAAVWLLPKATQMWESGEIRLDGVLAASKDDIRELAMVSQSPFYMFIPDGANQTAEGATTQREGITFKVGDHNTRDGIALSQLMSLAFEMKNDLQRARRGQLQTLWAPVQLYSLAEKADASSKAKGLSPRRILTDIWQLTPAEADEEIRQLNAANFLALATARTAAPQQPALQVPSTRADQQPQPTDDAAATA